MLLGTSIHKAHVFPGCRVARFIPSKTDEPDNAEIVRRAQPVVPTYIN